MVAEEDQIATCVGLGRTCGWPRTHRRQPEVGVPRAHHRRREAVAGEGGLRCTGWRPCRGRAQRWPDQGLRWRGASGERRSLMAVEAGGRRRRGREREGERMGELGSCEED